MGDNMVHDDNTALTGGSISGIDVRTPLPVCVLKRSSLLLNIGIERKDYHTTRWSSR